MREPCLGREVELKIFKVSFNTHVCSVLPCRVERARKGVKSSLRCPEGNLITCFPTPSHGVSLCCI